MPKTKPILAMALAAALVVAPAAARATMIVLTPASATVAVGDTLDIAIVADIDAGDAIVGFGFDLDLSGLGGLIFNGFTPGPLFADDLIFLVPVSDADGIRGASGGDLLFGAPASGANVLLGTLMFTASTAGGVVVDLGADDLEIAFSEGLIPLDLNLTNFLPPVASASVTIRQAVVAVPEPGGLALFGIGLIGLSLLRRRCADPR